MKLGYKTGKPPHEGINDPRSLEGAWKGHNCDYKSYGGAALGATPVYLLIVNASSPRDPWRTELRE